MKALRTHTKTGAMTEVQLIPVPIASDNIVCAYCKAELGENKYLIISKPRHKGVLAFACSKHVEQVKAILTPFLLNQEPQA